MIFCRPDHCSNTRRQTRRAADYGHRQNNRIRGLRLGRRDRPFAGGLHHHPRPVPPVRPRVAGERPHRPGDGSHRRVVCGPGHRGAHLGDPAAGRQDAAALHGDPGRDGRNRALVRAHGQAAAVHRLARRSGTLEAGDRGRQALRTRRRRRRLRRLRLAGRHRGAAAAGRPASPLHRAHRGFGGERQPGSARLSRSPERAHRHAGPDRLSGFRRRQLRPALGDHLAARHRRGRSARGRAHRGRALGHGQRHRAFEFPHCARAARAHRRPRDRRDRRAGVPGGA